MISKLILNFS